MQHIFETYLNTCTSTNIYQTHEVLNFRTFGLSLLLLEKFSLPPRSNPCLHLFIYTSVLTTTPRSWSTPPETFCSNMFIYYGKWIFLRNDHCTIYFWVVVDEDNSFYRQLYETYYFGLEYLLCGSIYE